LFSGQLGIPEVGVSNAGDKSLSSVSGNEGHAEGDPLVDLGCAIQIGIELKA